MPEIAYVNGVFMPLEQAVVSVEDRGFQFADGVYEVIGTYNGNPFAMEEHLVRLEQSLAALEIEVDIRSLDLEELIFQGLAQCGFAEVLIYIQITRGVAPRRHEFPGKSQATIVMTFKGLKRPASNLYEEGVAVISVPDLRWKRCDIKSIALLPNILAKQQAASVGAYEALLVDGEGRVTEGSSTSAFCVRDQTLLTAPQGAHILPSITRGQILSLAKEEGIPVREEFIKYEDFLSSDEVFIAGTTTESLGVVQIDGTPIGAGSPGPLTKYLRRAFLQNLVPKQKT